MEVFSSLRAFRVSMAASISDLGAPPAFSARTALPCVSTAACLSARDLRRESSVAAMEEDDREGVNVRVSGIES